MKSRAFKEANRPGLSCLFKKNRSHKAGARPAVCPRLLKRNGRQRVLSAARTSSRGWNLPASTTMTTSASAMSTAGEGMSATTTEGASAVTQGTTAAESPSGVTVTDPSAESPAPGKGLPAIVAASAKATSAGKAAPAMAKAPRPGANKDPA